MNDKITNPETLLQEMQSGKELYESWGRKGRVFYWLRSPDHKLTNVHATCIKVALRKGYIVKKYLSDWFEIKEEQTPSE